MAKGGWIVKFNDVEVLRCHTISFDYDMRGYTVNNKEKKPLPKVFRSIKIEIGED